MILTGHCWQQLSGNGHGVVVDGTFSSSVKSVLTMACSCILVMVLNSQSPHLLVCLR